MTTVPTDTVSDRPEGGEDHMADRAAVTNGLRELADWLDAHPEVPLPYELDDSSLSIFSLGEEPKATLATIARAMGRAEKFSTDSFYGVRRQFGAVTLEATAYHHEVCERVVVGVKQREVEEPDPEALAALPKVRRVIEEEIVEWRCPPSLLSDDEIAAGRAGLAQARQALHTTPHPDPDGA